MKLTFAFLFIVGLVAACGTSEEASRGDASTDSPADVRPDRLVESDAADPADAADAAYVPPSCDPNADGGGVCGAARKCCPLGAGASDGAISYGCVYLKPPNDFCP